MCKCNVCGTIQEKIGESTISICGGKKYYADGRNLGK